MTARTDTTPVKRRRAPRAGSSVEPAFSRTPPAPTPAPTPEQLRLREFADWLDAQDPVALARLVSEVESTLARCARIQIWFTRYAAAVRRKLR
jgi:hypothetical protein